MVKSPDASATAAGYESEAMLAEYLLFHYGKKQEILPYPFGPIEALDFPIRCVTECFDLASIPENATALDLGCAVGRASFELARHCKSVHGIDSSQRFITAAKQLQATGTLRFRAKTEGALTTEVLAEVPTEIDRERVRFSVGDALNLPVETGEFDVVLLANLIDRLPRPASLLERLPKLVRPGGQLAVVSPYTWLEEFTPQEEWLGGFQRDGKPVTTFGTVRERLSENFELTARRDLPFLIREHARKFQWSVAEATTWIRR